MGKNAARPSKVSLTNQSSREPDVPVPVASTRSLFSSASSPAIAKEAARKQATRRKIPEMVYGLVAEPGIDAFGRSSSERGTVSPVSIARMPELETQGSFAPPLLPHASVFLLVQTLCPLAPFADDAARPCAADADDVPDEDTHTATERARAVLQVPQAPAELTARPNTAGAAGAAFIARFAAPIENPEFECITSEHSPRFTAPSSSKSVAMVVESGRTARGCQYLFGGLDSSQRLAVELASGTEDTLPAKSTLVDWNNSSGTMSACVTRHGEAEHEQPVQKHLTTPSFRSRSRRQRILHGSEGPSPRIYPRNLTPLSGGPLTARGVTAELASPDSIIHRDGEPLFHAAALLSLPRLHPYNSVSLDSPSSRFLLPRFVRPKIPETLVPGAAGGNGSAPATQMSHSQLAESLGALERWVEGARESVDVTTHELHEESVCGRGPTENLGDTADVLHESATADALHYSPRLVSSFDAKADPRPPRVSTGIVTPVIGCTSGRLELEHPLADTPVIQAQWEAHVVPPRGEAGTSAEAAQLPGQEVAEDASLLNDEISATELIATAFHSRDPMEGPARDSSPLEASPPDISTQHFDVQALSPSPPAPEAIEEIVRQLLGASSDPWLPSPAPQYDARVPTATLYRTDTTLPVARSFIRIAPLSNRGHSVYPTTDESTGVRLVECDDAGASHNKSLACSGVDTAIPSEEDRNTLFQHSPEPAVSAAPGPARDPSSLPRVISSRIAVSRSSAVPPLSTATSARAAAQRSTALARSLQLRAAAGSFTGRSVDHFARTAYQSFRTHKSDAQ